jgi:hypothetical protein
MIIPREFSADCMSSPHIKFLVAMSSDGTATPVREAIIPQALVNGVPMLKISSKKIKQVIVRLEDLAITWASGTGNKGGLTVSLLTTIPFRTFILCTA